MHGRMRWSMISTSGLRKYGRKPRPGLIILSTVTSTSVSAVIGTHDLTKRYGSTLALGAPTWLLALSPFHHVAAVPQSAFDGQGALAMVVVAIGAAVAAVEVFLRRDLHSG
jgi:hypothetical protein